MSDIIDRFESVSEDGSIDGYEPTFVDVDGIRTRYYDVGSGEPLVLLHGGTWYGHLSANTWTATFDGLTDQFRIIALDRLGNGLTDSPEDESDFVFETEFEHALAFLDTMDLESFHLAGQSRGGGLAGRIAVERPESVRSLTVVNSATLAPSAGDYATRRNRLYRRAPTDATSLEYYRFFYEQMSYDPDCVPDDLVETATFMANRPKARRTDRIMGRTGQQDMWRSRDAWIESLQSHMELARRRLRRGDLDAPVLVWWGSNDPTVPLRSGIHLYDLLTQGIQDVRLNVVNRAGHFGYRERPTLFVRDVTSLASQAP